MRQRERQRWVTGERSLGRAPEGEERVGFRRGGGLEAGSVRFVGELVSQGDRKGRRVALSPHRHIDVLAQLAATAATSATSPTDQSTVHQPRDIHAFRILRSSSAFGWPATVIRTYFDLRIAIRQPSRGIRPWKLSDGGTGLFGKSD